jgi:hypothetical protein
VTEEQSSVPAGNAKRRRRLPGSQYRALAVQVKQWNPDLWDEWAELEKEALSWSNQEAPEQYDEHGQRSKRIRREVTRFLLQQNIAKDQIEAGDSFKYLLSCCLEDHGIEPLYIYRLPPG